jgi:cytochrome c-type biogenesis protein CcmH/NrfG
MNKSSFFVQFRRVLQSAPVSFWCALIVCGIPVACYVWQNTSAGYESSLQNASVAHLLAASRRDPQNPRVLYHLGNRALAEGRLQGAYESFQKAAALEPDSEEICLRAAHVADLVGDGAGAFRGLNRFLQAHPNRPAVLMALARLYQRVGVVKDARRNMEEVVKAQPQNAKAWFLLGTLSQSMVYVSDNRAALERAVALQPANLEYVLQLARFQALDNRLDEAETSYRRALSLAPQNAKAMGKLGDFLITYGQTLDKKREARTLLEGALQIDSRNDYARYQLGRMLLDDGDVPQAIKYLKSALRGSPNNAVGWYALAQAYNRSGDVAGARQAVKTLNLLRKESDEGDRIRAYVASAPEDAARRLELARHYVRSRSPMDALGQYYRALRLVPDDVRIKTELRAYEARLKATGQMPSMSLYHAVMSAQRVQQAKLTTRVDIR